MLRACSLALLVLSLQLPLTAAAQTQDPDLGLLAGQLGSSPNVMLLVDTSGSMQHVVWHPEFNPKVFHDAGSPCTATVLAKSGTGMCPGSGRAGDVCPENDIVDFVAGSPVAGLVAGSTVTCTASAFVSGCGDIPSAFGCRISRGRLSIDVPDVDRTNDVDPSDSSVVDEPNEGSYWAPNYIHWFMKRLATTGRFPTSFELETRKIAAKRVLKDIIQELNPTLPGGSVDQRIRFGIAVLHTDARGVANGGYVIEPIAANNRTRLLTALRSDRVRANTSTPLSEALVDVGRYFVGNLRNPSGRAGLGTYPVYNRNMTDGGSTGSSPASPLDPNVLCRSNFVIVLTDGDPYNDANDHHGSAFMTTFGPDYDGDGDSNNAADLNDTLDDVAAYLSRNDLVNESVMPGKQNIVTYTIGFALDVKLLKNAARNGDGEYYTASNGQMLAEHLRSSLEDIVLRAGSFTAAAVPASRSAFGDGFYTTYFEPQRRGTMYIGHLQAYRIDENFDIVGPDGLSALDPVTGALVRPPFWDAATKLKDPNNLPRKLYVTPPDASATRDFTPANLTAAHLNVTDADVPRYVSPAAAPISNGEGLADALVKYVSGEDRFDEDADRNVTELRKDLETSAVLGDIFHSSPRVVGPPSTNLVDEPGFSQPTGDPNTFLVRYGQREKLIYAGANDGMLHAFNAGNYRTGDNPLTTSTTESAYYDMGTGVEKFGWVPRSLLPTLKQLTLPGAHPFYVDGPITVADAWFPGNASDSSKGGDEWATALVVGMRNGAKSYLALDITDPSVTDPNAPHGPFPKLLWELNDPNEPLGKTWSRAVITRVRLKGSMSDDFCGTSNGEGASIPGQPGNCREEWVAIFGAGYMEQGDPSATQFLSDPNAAGWDDDSKGIFMVSLATGQVLARVSYQAGSAPLAEMKYSFPSEPAVLDLNSDGFADVVYIGDTGGQLWKWDISTTGVRDGRGRVPTSVWPVGRFFVAPTASNGHRRSFFYPPTASFAGGKLVLGIGTGERTKADYRSTGGDENRYYVIQDRTPTGTGAFVGLPLAETNLTLLAANGVDTDPADYGFYLVADRDEKFISDSLAFGGFAITASYVPKPANPAAPCQGGGEARLYILSLGNGAGFFTPTEPGRIDSRRVTLGGGMPSSVSVTVSGDKARITLQMSDSSVKSRSGPAPKETPVDLIFWKQDL